MIHQSQLIVLKLKIKSPVPVPVAADMSWSNFSQTLPVTVVATIYCEQNQVAAHIITCMHANI
jgi:hypothetical protein